jgi:hypothetical protein
MAVIVLFFCTVILDNLTYITKRVVIILFFPLVFYPHVVEMRFYLKIFNEAINVLEI